MCINLPNYQTIVFSSLTANTQLAVAFRIGPRTVKTHDNETRGGYLNLIISYSYEAIVEVFFVGNVYPFRLIT